MPTISINLDDFDAAEKKAQSQFETALQEQAAINELVAIASKTLEDIQIAKRVLCGMASKGSGLTKTKLANVSTHERPSLSSRSNGSKYSPPIGNNKRLVFSSLRTQLDEFQSPADLASATSLTQNQVHSVLQDSKERGEVIANGKGAGTKYKLHPKGLKRLEEAESVIRRGQAAA